MRHAVETRRVHLSWRYNGFGFLILWCRGLYVQFGTIKLIITKPVKPIAQTLGFYEYPDMVSFKELASQYLAQETTNQ